MKEENVGWHNYLQAFMVTIAMIFIARKEGVVENSFSSIDWILCYASYMYISYNIFNFISFLCMDTVFL